MLYGDILADFHACLDVNANFAHDIDFSLDDVFLQLIGRNAIAQHATRFLILLEYSGFVAHSGKVIGATQSRGATADNGNLLFPVILDIRADVHIRDETRFGLQVLLRNEFLHGIDGDGLVDGATGACVLATSVTHATAHGWEGVLTLDKFECLGVFAFSGFLQITLHGNVSRTGGLTRCRTRRVAVDAVFVAVVFIPFVFAPLPGIGQFLLGIGLLTMFGAELLA